jgi:hypothetical protein
MSLAKVTFITLVKVRRYGLCGCVAACCIQCMVVCVLCAVQVYSLSVMLHGFWRNESVRLLRSTFVTNTIVY